MAGAGPVSSRGLSHSIRQCFAAILAGREAFGSGQPAGVRGHKEPPRLRRRRLFCCCSRSATVGNAWGRGPPPEAGAEAGDVPVERRCHGVRWTSTRLGSWVSPGLMLPWHPPSLAVGQGERSYGVSATPKVPVLQVWSPAWPCKRQSLVEVTGVTGATLSGMSMSHSVRQLPPEWAAGQQCPALYAHQLPVSP